MLPHHTGALHMNAFHQAQLPVFLTTKPWQPKAIPSSSGNSVEEGNALMEDFLGCVGHCPALPIYNARVCAKGTAMLLDCHFTPRLPGVLEEICSGQWRMQPLLSRRRRAMYRSPNQRSCFPQSLLRVAVIPGPGVADFTPHHLWRKLGSMHR